MIHLFNVETWQLNSGALAKLRNELQIVAVMSGQLEIKGGSDVVNLSAGQFCLIPAILERTEIMAKSDAALLRIEAN